MPAVVQHSNRNPTVQRVDAHRDWSQPVLPRAAENGQVEVWTGAVGRALCEGGHKRVDPLANPRSVAERRPIIDQDTHMLLAGGERRGAVGRRSGTRDGSTPWHSETDPDQRQQIEQVLLRQYLDSIPDACGTVRGLMNRDERRQAE